MSEQIRHECGIALIRLLKPLSYFIEKYGTPLYGLNKLYLLMEKQHNRGQDGAGISVINFDVAPGNQYIYRRRSLNPDPLADIFTKVQKKFKEVYYNSPDKFRDADWLKSHVPFTGELLLGHLRYGTHSKRGINYCHPHIRQNNWMSRNLVLAGNFNMTNNDELFNLLVDLGQHPRDTTDTVTVLEKIGHFLDEENERLYRKYKEQNFSKKDISPRIAKYLSLNNVLKNAAEDLDGGYTMAGMIGHGDAFVLRDPSGIRPAHYYKDDEILVVASERPAIKTAFNLPFENIKKIKPGHALTIKKDGRIKEEKILEPLENRSCSFERIYFSRGTDDEIYRERKNLGRLLTGQVLEAIDYDFENTVFSYIPNTAETAFLGLVKGVEHYLNDFKKKQILKNPGMKEKTLGKLLNLRPRVEKIAVKDAKLRTFITADENRNEMVAHVYDTTYGIIRPDIDNLVIVDDSIVRGTTLRNSIINILSRLKPKKIIIVSSAPQIRFPDCYGIDMSKMHDFIAFRAAISLLKETCQSKLIDDIYKKCKESIATKKPGKINHVKDIYRPFSVQEISGKISELVKPPYVNSDVKIIYNSIENLKKASPDHQGDWYFTGDFPTPGGNKVVNRAFVNYYEGKNVRAY